MWAPSLKYLSDALDALQGLGLGAVIGGVIGLVAGLFLARRTSTDLNKPVVPPPGGWRRWDEDDD